MAGNPFPQSKEQLLQAYRTMRTIREFEERLHIDFGRGDIPGFVHLYAGEEAAGTGIMMHLGDGDRIASTHRGHGHCLAKGARLEPMMAEIMGKEAGYCRGKGGSMHIADQDTGNLGANAIVGGSAGIATGAALSAKKRGSDQVAVCFFGEGALGQGLLYEVMNMAQLWKLPVIYVCENNLYNEYTHFQETTAGDLAGRAQGFGMHSEEVDGQDVRAVYAVMQRLVERARGGEGPAFVVANTYRYYGHHVGDIDRAYYRSKEEEQDWRNTRDPLQLLGRWLVASGQVDQVTLEQISAEVQAEVETGVAFALEAPYPEASEVDLHVYA